MTGPALPRYAPALPDRRAALAGLVRFAGGATTLLAGLAGTAGPAAPVAADDARLRTASVRQTVAPGHTLTLYMALPARARGRRPAVMIVHDERGLDEAARALARRVALEGYVACAPDFLSRLGGSPADGGAARIMTAALEPAGPLADALATARWLGRNPPGERVLTGRVASVGLGWGSGLIQRVAADAGQPLAAGVAYGGPVPDPREADRTIVPLLFHLAGPDAYGTASGLAWANALRAAGKPIEAYVYDGANPAPGGDPAAAELAWQRTSAFLKRFLS